MKRIFVSATTRDLGSHRLLASQSLRKRGYEVDDQAIFDSTPVTDWQKQNVPSMSYSPVRV